MRKFSNLQSLRIVTRISEFDASGPTLIKFMQYAMSRPVFDIRIFVRKEDLLNIVTEFMKMKNGCKNVIIDYSDRHRPTFVLCELHLHVKTGARLTFVPNADANEIKYFLFLSEAGRLRSLILSDFDQIPDVKGEASKSIDWLFNIIQLCPLLEKCTIHNAAYLSASHRKSKYPYLKKLSMTRVKRSKSLEFLNSLSLSLPNLRKLFLGIGYYTDNNHTDPVVIDMSHLSLDLLTWCDHPTVKHGSDLEVYIKLKSERGIRYYSADKHVLLSVDESLFLLATQHLRFDINCKDLKEFRITGHRFRRPCNCFF